MNARSYRQAYDKPAVLEIQRKRAERLSRGRPRGTDEDRRLALVAKRQREAENRRKAAVSLPPVPTHRVHQLVPTFTPPLRGSIALSFFQGLR
jgi:hypothetical protein